MIALPRLLLWLVICFCITISNEAQLSVHINYGVYTVSEDAQVDVVDEAFPVKINRPAGWFAYYTLDGTEPTVNSTPVTDGPLRFWQYGLHDLRVVGYSSDLSESDRLRVGINVVPSVSLNVEPLGFYTITSEPPPQRGVYLTNSLVTVTALSKDGWTFKEWRGSIEATEPVLQFPLKAETFLKAVHTTTLAGMANGPGTIRVEPTKEAYERGEAVVLHAEPNENAFLTGWSEPGLQDPYIYTVTDPNKTITANFGQAAAGQVTLDAVVMGSGGYILPSPPRWVFFPGEAVTLTAVPINGAFKGWVGGSGAITNKYSFTISEDTTITAETERLLKWKTSPGFAMSPPAIGKDGTIYTTSYRNLFAWTPEGKLKWTKVAKDWTSTSIGPSGTIYARTWIDLRAYTPGGELLWSIPVNKEDGFAIDANENLYFTSRHDRSLYSYDADGQERWRSPLPLDLIGGTQPVISRNGVVAVQGGNSATSIGFKTMAFDEAGTHLWTGGNDILVTAADQNGNFIAPGKAVVSLRENGSTNWIMQLHFAASTAVVAADGTVYAKSRVVSGDAIAKISPQGTLIWTKYAGEMPIIDAGDLLYHFEPPALNRINMSVIGPDNGLIYSAGFSGTAKWATLGADNTIYWAENDGSLTAIKSLNGPALNAWSTSRGNPQRTSSILPDAGNRPPLLPVIQGQLHGRGEATEFEMIVSDDGSGGDGITVTGSSENSELVADENIEISGTGEVRTVRITPTPGVYGTARITITATDADGASSTREFLFTVEEQSDEPELTIDLVPAITLKGEVGQSYRIESRPKVESGAWALLTTVTLTNEVQHVYVDLGTGAEDRFYRAVSAE